MATPRLGLVVEDKPTELSYTCNLVHMHMHVHVHTHVNSMDPLPCP